jgi:hypothetical protein
MPILMIWLLDGVVIRVVSIRKGRLSNLREGNEIGDQNIFL